MRAQCSYWKKDKKYLYTVDVIKGKDWRVWVFENEKRFSDWPKRGQDDLASDLTFQLGLGYWEQPSIKSMILAT